MTCEIGQRLKQLRKDKKLTQKDISDFLRISRTTYAKYESGDIALSIETLNKLSSFFDVSTHFLLGESPPPIPSPFIDSPDILNLKLADLMQVNENDGITLGELLAKGNKKVIKQFANLMALHNRFESLPPDKKIAVEVLLGIHDEKFKEIESKHGIKVYKTSSDLFDNNK